MITDKADLIFWPEGDEIDMPERPIAIRRYSDGVIQLNQLNNEILLHQTDLNDFIKALKRAQALEASDE